MPIRSEEVIVVPSKFDESLSARREPGTICRCLAGMSRIPKAVVAALPGWQTSSIPDGQPQAFRHTRQGSHPDSVGRREWQGIDPEGVAVIVWQSYPRLDTHSQ